MTFEQEDVLISDELESKAHRIAQEMMSSFFLSTCLYFR